MYQNSVAPKSDTKDPKAKYETIREDFKPAKTSQKFKRQSQKRDTQSPNLMHSSAGPGIIMLEFTQCAALAKMAFR